MQNCVHFSTSEINSILQHQFWRWQKDNLSNSRWLSHLQVMYGQIKLNTIRLFSFSPSFSSGIICIGGNAVAFPSSWNWGGVFGPSNVFWTCWHLRRCSSFVWSCCSALTFVIYAFGSSMASSVRVYIFLLFSWLYHFSVHGYFLCRQFSQPLSHSSDAVLETHSKTHFPKLHLWKLSHSAFRSKNLPPRYEFYATISIHNLDSK